MDFGYLGDLWSACDRCHESWTLAEHSVAEAKRTLELLGESDGRNWSDGGE